METKSKQLALEVITGAETEVFIVRVPAATPAAVETKVFLTPDDLLTFLRS